MSGKYRNLFPGGNTTHGFHSYYNYIADQKKVKKIFCLKGGPGSGKSTFMKDVARYFKGKGEGVDYLWCSSDPASLDGIILTDRDVVLVDGTAPHITDPVNPVAVDMILDLGEFIDENKIKEYRDEILDCNKETGKLFNIAYGYLNCLTSQYELMDRFISAQIDEIEIWKVLSEIKRNLKLKEKYTKGNIRKMFASAITSEGIVSGIDSICTCSDQIITIKVPVGFKSEKILSNLSEIFCLNGYDVELFFCPIDPLLKIEHIFIPELSMLISTENEYHSIKVKGKKQIKDLEIKGGNVFLDELYKSSDYLLNTAIKFLKKAKSNHDILESYYIKSIDFKGVEALRNKVIRKIETM